MTAHVGRAVDIERPAAGTPAKPRLALVGVLALGALGWSAYLGSVSMGWVKLGLCSTGSCSELVLSSSWARLAGVPVSAMGMGVYLAILCALPFTVSQQMAHRRAAWSALVAMAFLIVGVAMWFIGLMTVHLHKSCGHCAGMHMLGMVIAYFLVTTAPMGKDPAALRPKRVLGLAAIAIAAVGLLVGGQLLARPVEGAGGQHAPDEQALTESGFAGSASTPLSNRGPAALPTIQQAVARAAESKLTPPTADDAAPKAKPDLNTPEGKAAIEAQLRDTYGDRWNKPDSVCQFTSSFAVRPGVRQTASELSYEVLQEGLGRRPGPQDRVRMHARGTLWSGEVFEDTFASGRPMDLRVSDMIPGLAEALVMMPTGSRWRLLLSPHLAYGVAGLPGRVPPQTPVFYEVQLLDILPPAPAHAVNAVQVVKHQEESSR